MRKTNARELKHATASILDRVEQGETIEITRHNRVIAVLSPPQPEKNRELETYDYAERLKEIFGDRKMPTTGTELMTYDRGDR